MTNPIQKDFDEIARAECAGRWNHNNHYHPYILKHLPDVKNLALEVGCGSGDFAATLEKHFDNVTAIDFSGEMIRQAREKHRLVT